MLPDIILAMATMPSSLTLEWVYSQWPDTFAGLLQLVYLTACATLQTAILFVLAWLGRGRDH
jgi:hypothetical protein